MTERWFSQTHYPDKDVIVRTAPVCQDCPANMVTDGDYDSHHEVQRFKCPVCGKTISVDTPTSGGVQ